MSFRVCDSESDGAGILTINNRTLPVSVGSYRRPMVSEAQAPTQDQIEDAIKKTLCGWADELDTGRKFWSADWAKLVGDAITAVQTRGPVLYPDDEEG